MNLLQLQRDIPTVGPDILFHIFGFPVTNTTIMSVLITGIIAVASVMVVKRSSLIPTGFGNFAEWLYEGMLGLVEQITGNAKMAKNIFPIIGAIFVFFGISNLIGLLPGLRALTLSDVSILRQPTTDLNTTVSIAIVMVLFIQYESIRRFGFLGHVAKYLQFNKVLAGFRRGMGAGFSAVVGFFIGLLDIVGEFAKVISLSLRLFGNMYAGIVLSVIIMGALAYALPSVWMAMGILTGIVQAIVFGALVAAYYSIAVEEV